MTKVRDNVDERLAELMEKYGFTRPERGLDDYPAETQWREGKPDYRKADLVYFEGRTRNHPSGSLAQVVETLVKKWEMEMTHLGKKDWVTVDETYRVCANGKEEKNGTEAAKRGTYNWLLDGISKDLYDSSKHTFESSHKLFRGAFKDGFPWEVLEVLSGPPRVAFTWRHWGTFNGEYEDRKGKGEVIELYGIVIATVNESLLIQHLDVFFKPDGFLEALKGNLDPADLKDGKELIGSTCPIHNLQNSSESDN